jgi:uncharacterized membrane protein
MFLSEVTVYTVVLLFLAGYVAYVAFAYIWYKEKIRRTLDVHLAMIALMVLTVLIWVFQRG